MAENNLYEIRYAFTGINDGEAYYSYNRRIVTGKTYSDAIRKIHKYCKDNNKKVIDIEYLNMIASKDNIIE